MNRFALVASGWGEHHYDFYTQNGSGAPRAPHIGECEILNLHRTIDFEPSRSGAPEASGSENLYTPSSRVTKISFHRTIL